MRSRISHSHSSFSPRAGLSRSRLVNNLQSSSVSSDRASLAHAFVRRGDFGGFGSFA